MNILIKLLTFLKPVRRLTFSSVSNRVTTALLQFLILVILLGFLGGTIKTASDLTMIMRSSVVESLRVAIINILALLALLEVFRTVQSYLDYGRVKVTFIVDTVLIILLNEVISYWFQSGLLTKMAPLLITIGILLLVRIAAIRFHPHKETDL
ncbi:hypothetical protein HGB07_02570 [Candidatus Roizmanbacteria bacterium]|nr:hypothetical protein [Candidatus Roizmanbacteria bacterium]